MPFGQSPRPEPLSPRIDMKFNHRKSTVNQSKRLSNHKLQRENMHQRNLKTEKDEDYTITDPQATTNQITPNS